MKIQNINVNLAQMQEGELQKSFEKELKRVIESFIDDKTDLKKKRKIQINLEFSVYEERGLIVTSDIKTTIPKKSIQPTLIAAVKSVPGIYNFTESYPKKQISGQISFEDIIQEEIHKDNILSMYDDVQEN